MWPGSDDELDGQKSPRSQMLQEMKLEEEDPTRGKAMVKAESTRMMEQKQLPRGLGPCDEDQYEIEVAKLTTEIEEGFLYLGQEADHALDMDTLNMKGYEITHMLNIGTKPKKLKTEGERTVERFDISDLPSETIGPLVKRANKFIATAKRNKGKVLVFCKDDKPTKDGPTYSRSACMLAGYIMASRKMNANDAVDVINKCRTKMFQKPVQINHGFKRQLKGLQKDLNIPSKK